MGAGTQLAVQYEVDKQVVSFDANFLKQYLVRGGGKISDQEAIFFMNLCKAQKLNPLNGTDCYCVKYGDKPAQLIVGKSAYMKRAFNNPNYLYKEDGVVVMSNNTVTKKEGCCVYPGERLIGGWCRVHYTRNGVQCHAYKEVAFSEYDKGQSTWKAMPATMIVKVAISQCVRDAFPDEYAGLYCEDEMVASGAMKQEDVYVKNEAESDEIVYTVPAEAVEEKKPAISPDERKSMIALAMDAYDDKAVAQESLKALLAEEGCADTYSLNVDQYANVMAKLKKVKNDKGKSYIDGIDMAIEEFKESENGIPFV